MRLPGSTRRLPLVGLVFVAGLLPVLAPSEAMALDVQVSSSTSTQVYEVRGRTADLFLQRRRVTERLSLGLAGLLPGEEEPGYDGPRLSIDMTLRVDADFGARSLETRPLSDLWFVPGYDPYALDLLTGRIVVRDLFARTTRIAAGRIVSFGPTGFSALDGLEVRVRLPWHLELAAASGAEVVAGQHLSSGVFEVDGVVRQRRDDLDPLVHPEVEEPEARVVVAASAAVVGFDWISAEVGYRHGLLPLGRAVTTSYQRLGGTVAFDAGIVEGGVLASGDLALGLVDEISAEVAVRPARWIRLGLAGRYDAPVFDTDSVFAAFWADPAIEGALRVELALHESFRLGGSGLVRQVEFLSPVEEESPLSEVLRFGGEGHARLRLDRYRGELRARLSDGFGGRRAGVQARFAARLPGERVTLDLRGILLGARREILPQKHLVSLGYVLGARYRMSPEAELLFELEHNYSHVLGQQFRFLVLLDLEVGI